MKIALTIASSDSGGGAGIQADLKTFLQFGVHGTSAVVALTAQNTTGVDAIHLPPAEFLQAQLASLAGDLPPAACKTGMLATAELAGVVAQALTRYGWRDCVCDPVMVASSGDRLLDPAGEAVYRERLIPLARLVTPNLDEAEVLTGLEVRDPAGMERAGRRLLELGAAAALVKGGHLPGSTMVDLLVTSQGVRRYERPRVATTSTHGTGCTLSAAITAGLAQGRALEQAVTDALDYVHRALQAAPGLGAGHGPLHHGVPGPRRL